MARRSFFGTVRLALLLAVLAFVALGAWLDRWRSTHWDTALRVTVYPLAATPDPATRDYVAGVDSETFADVAQFLDEQAAHYGLNLEEPVRIRISHAVHVLPPAAPARPGPLSIAIWSLRLRWWAWRIVADDPLPPPDVQVFAIYQPPSSTQAAADSTGLTKGLLAVTHLFADGDAAGSNAVVVAPELLHTLGATDKYDLANGQPIAPDGLGDPAQQPLYPQQTGEIMAGRIALSVHDAVIPDDLGQMTVGPATAREIGWLR